MENNEKTCIGSRGVSKLKAAMTLHGYKKVAEDCKVSQSILFQYCSGKRDPIGMRLMTAVKLNKIYRIPFEDWFDILP